ncbi:CamS family sex pheromone protein [Virgibacillus sp. DJP39]|uniref:CamS family sex pheromone protein n=1 Tax=Virgibacillus sp. DJP39 TaxID=3409790 RepID=UPI003BB7779C
MKKLAIWLTGALLFMTSCSPNINEDELVKKENETANQNPSIVPSYQLSDEEYKMILPYKPSAARGVITGQMGNRLDIDQVEEGLRRHSKKYYDPGNHFFQAGQQLSESTVYSWIDGLNPVVKEDAKEEVYRENPRYLSHILEQNFLKKKKDNTVELAGISIGLALKSEYRFQTESGGPYYEKISQEVMLKQGKQMAQTILERVRKMEGLDDVPIVFAIYREEAQGTPIPGDFVAKTQVKGSDMSIGDWDSIQEEHVLFPSDKASTKYSDNAQLISSFTNEVAQFFPNYTGVIGEGFYMNEELMKLTLEVPIEFYGKGEVIGFSQYAYGLVKEMFPNDFDLEIKVTSSEKVESLIYRRAGVEDPTVHILH